MDFQTLEIGDYISGGVAIERKSEDFLDFKRLKTQAAIMKSTYGDRSYLVVEHNLDDIVELSTNYFHKDMKTSILGIVASLAVREKIVPIFCSNQAYAAYIIRALCEKGNDSKISAIKLSKPRVKKKDRQVHFLCGLPGIEETIALRLLDKFGTVQTIINASEEEFLGIEKLGKIKVEKILNVLR